ncbi:MAG: MMPL family transporter [Bacteroidales bacterium]|nr:MMPL family transporter [Bacteroidales bacterium]
MWIFIIRHILRNRLANLIIIGILTALMGYKALQVQMSYEPSSLLPESDTAFKVYREFTDRFGKDGSVLFIAVRDTLLYTTGRFSEWFDLTYIIKGIRGVEEVLSEARLFLLVRNDSLKKFDFRPLTVRKPKDQTETDSLKKEIRLLPFYEGRLFNAASDVTLMAITLEERALKTKDRVRLIQQIKSETDAYGRRHGLQMHYSGLPYIRVETARKLEREELFFVLLAMAIASVILLVFFRSFRAVFFPMLIVMICVIWVIGTMSLFRYKVTMLTGIVPPLLIVIVVENCIFLLTKYHNEYRKHGNKVLSLSRVVQRIGNANFLTNATTAAGFAAFIITGNRILVEFGIVASLNIMVAYMLTLMLVPIFFSYLPPPRERQTRHLERGTVQAIVERVVMIVQQRRNVVYYFAVVIALLAVVGVIRLQNTGSIVDDIPRRDPLYKDLVFMEKHFRGVMPFEISIDTRKKRGVMQMHNIRRTAQLQDSLEAYPELSRSLALNDVLKLAKQAFYRGDPRMYELPNNQERPFILSYVPEMKPGQRSILNSFVDTSMRFTRITTQMANITTTGIQRITDDLRPKIQSIFPPEDYTVHMTGTSVVFLKGTQYLVRNLLTSLVLALLVITGLMALLFTSFRMIIISLIPNIFPLLLTAAMMGFLNIQIKPSTVLIFSIALGISVDNAIHFLSRYRLQLRLNEWNIRESALAALRETGFSMIYSSVVLFFGFIIFVLSSFGGTESLGYLIAFTLIVALLSNLFLLPSLILTMDKRITTRTFQEPLIVIFDEEDDIELNDLELEHHSEQEPAK